MHENIEVVGLSYYPIKSCAAIDADTVSFNEFGIEYDREWMLVGKHGQPLTQRVHPELALVTANIADGSLVVAAPRMGNLAVPLEVDPDSKIVPVNLWDKPGAGRDQGAEVSAWFTDYLGKDTRLLRVSQSRQVKPECQVEGAADRTGFADGFPLLVASMDSLAVLNEQLEQPVTIDRFRPNIVVAGAEAYDEDYWREVKIGAMRAFVVRACARCPMPNIDQKVGVLPKQRPVTDALRATRGGTDPLSDSSKLKEFFAQNAVHVYQPGAVVQLHDRVEVVTRSSRRNWDVAA